MKAWFFGAGLLLLATGAGAFSWRATTVRGAVEMRRTAADHHTQVIDASLPTLRARIVAAEAKREELRARLRALAVEVPGASRVPHSAPTGSPTQSGATTINEALKQWQDENKRPEVQLKHLSARREQLPDTFGPFYRQLRLSAAEVRTFEDLFMRREEQVGDLMAVAQSQGLSLRDKAVGKLWSEIYADTETRQRDLLGEAGFGALKTYERTTGVRDIVRNLAAMATVFGDPISAGQMEQLIPLLAETVETYRKGHYASANEIDWIAGLAAASARSVLTPGQLELIQTFEPYGGGMFLSRWNGELVKATRPETLSLPKP